MSLQADISWIKSELNNVTEPDLIEAIKRLLSIRKKPVEYPMTTEEFVADIREAEEQIKNGDYLSIDEFEKESDKWD